MNRFQSLTISFFLMTLLLTSCKEDEDDNADCTDYQWEYEGATAPDDWAICFINCDGQTQSPVNITGAVVDTSLVTLNTNYADAPIELVNKGYTLELEYEAGSTLRLNGADYDLLQFHFHTASEHTVDATQYPMEVHLVHQNADTKNLAVIGIFFEEGAENAFLANFGDDLPVDKDDRYTSTDQINVSDLLPSNKAYYTYSGSLTTPPCSEIVTWFVLKTPIEASKAQIEDMHDIMSDNFRPIQALNGREIKEFN